MNKQTNWLPTLIAVVILGAMFAPSLGGCQKIGGWEIASWFGKVTVRPVAPPKPIDPPKSRCLIFGFDSCQACKTLHRTIRRELVPAGWRVGPDAIDDIEDIDIYSSSPKVAAYKHSSYPTLIVVDQAGKELARKTGAIGGKELAEWIRSFRK